MGLSPFIVQHSSTVQLHLQTSKADHHGLAEHNLKRSPHSDPGPPATAPTTSESRAQLDINQWNVVLDTIRANLNLIVGTWGRGSRQYDEARGVILAYLEENLGRLRGQEQGGRENGGGNEERERVSQGEVDVEMRTVETGIEELLGELTI